MDISKLLSEPFNPDLIKWRVGSTNAKQLGCKPWEATKGIALAYIDARIVMARLDDVLGVDGWQDEYFETASGRVICNLKCRINGDWVSKSDGAGDTGTEGEKGAISDAFKRAAVKFGIGRYLYAFPNNWVDLNKGKIVKVPDLPNFAYPSQYKSPIVVAYECNEQITEIKNAIKAGDLDTMRATFRDLEEDEQTALWRAPTKGGVFATEERSILLNNMGS